MKNTDFITDGAPIKRKINNEVKPLNYTDSVTNYFNRIKKIEGLRGISNRSSVMFKYISYFFSILLFSSLTQALTDGIQYAQGGGIYMLLSCTTISFTGAIATFFYTNLRNELIAKIKHYIFGIIILPGTLLAGFLNITKSFWGDDTLSSTLALAVPVVFLVTVVLPSFIFVKEVTGMRSLYRSNLDDQEAVTLWTRQDGLQK